MQLKAPDLGGHLSGTLAPVYFISGDETLLVEEAADAILAAARNAGYSERTVLHVEKGRSGCHFSFSGLKTAVLHTVDALPPGELSDADVADLCASFQAAAGDVLVDRTANALHLAGIRTLVVAGGVAANAYLRERLTTLALTEGVRLVAPPQALCTDNGAMIAWAGIERLRLGLSDPLDVAPRPRWPLDPDATPAAFAGVKA